MIPVNRYVEYFNKYDDVNEELGTLVGRFNITDVPLRKLKKIVFSDENDPYLYNLYDLSDQQLFQLNALLEMPIDYHIDKFDYCLSCIAVPGYYSSHKIRGKRKGGYPAPF